MKHKELANIFLFQKIYEIFKYCSPSNNPMLGGTKKSVTVKLPQCSIASH